MTTRDPWMKFFPSDWRSDPRLRMCGLSARGLWIEMLSLMHESDPYGHLLVSGIAPTDAQLGVLVGAPSDQIPDMLGELETAGVFSRTRAGVIYSRRMTRDEKRRQTGRKNGKFGGNPSLRKTREKPPSDNLSLNLGDNTHMPEARGQIPEKKEDARQRASQPVFDDDLGLDPDVVRLFREHRRAMKASLTEGAIKQLCAELRRLKAAGRDPNDGLREAMLRGWRSVKADWLLKGQQPEPERPRVERGYGAKLREMEAGQR